MGFYTMPLTSDPDQTFSSVIPVDGANLTLQFRVRYNDVAGYWWMTISDKSGNVLIDALPLLNNGSPTGNILEQYAYLKIGSAYIINNGNSSLDSPDISTLGTDFTVVWGNGPA